jgi:hypothetical protein
MKTSNLLLAGYVHLEAFSFTILDGTPTPKSVPGISWKSSIAIREIVA